ncbi:hypothetical protein FOXG_18391 [Fusarium oxysporum f. sp. lycopersici 4287]|uniref:Uncharacterized protein n=1 Tax=Fusarium oxysporum f. sp. lycopersici (strain 4287 / CBS 123668 / FGSC 9935 / NRRL 34936) TaxID=426428 RepID=A0A0J9UHL8_FUSO4|nr:hypothetical protein FOXG_18391 [Fusarium oxysporum f. sp. lycopersici 4287]KAJ9421234.1 hypothetical protein QL093DRAFT_2101091 [Fusarium oxysporum]KNA98337.1 hypothetical protein FOXG_18391 [Fusarium oxysporum f. sp. lycopersici 4287]
MTKDVLEKMNTKTPSFDLGMAEEADVGYTPEEERRVFRKIDHVVLSLMSCVEFLQYLDKQSIGYAAVFNLRSITPEITSLGT